MKRCPASLGALTILIWCVTACSMQTPTPTPLVTDYAGFIEHLRAAHVLVEPDQERVSPDFFSVKSHNIKVNGERIFAYEYADSNSAIAEAANTSTDGFLVNGNAVDWIAAPHFYKSGRLIVLYLGDNTSVTDALEAVLGQQFAGTPKR